jgi:hypothetical protein
MKIAGKNEQALYPILDFVKKGRRIEATAVITVEVSTFARSEATDAEIAADRARGFMVRAYLGERLDPSVQVISRDQPQPPQKFHNRFDDFTRHTAKSGAVRVVAACVL